MSGGNGSQLWVVLIRLVYSVDPGVRRIVQHPNWRVTWVAMLHLRYRVATLENGRTDTCLEIRRIRWPGVFVTHTHWGAPNNFLVPPYSENYGRCCFLSNIDNSTDTNPFKIPRIHLTQPILCIPLSVPACSLRFTSMVQEPLQSRLPTSM